MTGQFGLQGTFKGRLVQPPCNKQGHLQLDQLHHMLMLQSNGNPTLTLLCSAPPPLPLGLGILTETYK